MPTHSNAKLKAKVGMLKSFSHLNFASYKRLRKMEKERKYEIPPDGSLGLLALGYRGVVAWRKVRDEALKSEKAGKSGKS